MMIIFKARAGLYSLMEIFMMGYGIMDCQKDKELIKNVRKVGDMRVIGAKALNQAMVLNILMMELITKAIS